MFDQGHIAVTFRRPNDSLALLLSRLWKGCGIEANFLKLGERGDSAEIPVRTVKTDDAEPFHVTVQKFRVHLPHSQNLSA